MKGLEYIHRTTQYTEHSISSTEALVAVARATSGKLLKNILNTCFLLANEF